MNSGNYEKMLSSFPTVSWLNERFTFQNANSSCEIESFRQDLYNSIQGFVLVPNKTDFHKFAYKAKKGLVKIADDGTQISKNILEEVLSISCDKK